MLLLENNLEKIGEDQELFNALVSLSVKLQRRVSYMVKLLDFNPDTSDQSLIKAIDYYRAVDGDIQVNAPIDFLTEQEKQVVFNEDKLRVSLYKILLSFRYKNYKLSYTLI